MLIHAIAHGGCINTVRESALKVDSGSKTLAVIGTGTHISFVPWLFSQMLCQLSCPYPLQLAADCTVTQVQY